MCREITCMKCEYKDDLKSCVKKHIETARKLLDQGKIEEAKAELESLKKHLK